ncbi:MAG: NUDIX hydrolase [Chloroflexales bacterium]|nr:NUDIX hydrolase [Chloroflexales bacterium]
MPLLNTSAAKRRAYACILLDKLAASAPTESGLPGRPVYLDDLDQADYLLGILDLLTFLGALQHTNDGLGFSVVSPQAGWALRLLNDLLDTGKPLVGDWHSAGLTERNTMHHPFRKATDLLAALEARRGDLLPEAAPVREVEAAVGLIARADQDANLHFLLTYDDDARAWQLPGGRRETFDFSLEETLLRELGEELGLKNVRVPGDLTLLPLAPLVATRDSPSYGVRTKTLFYPFLVELHLDPPTGRNTCWFSCSELLEGRATDGQTLDSILPLRLLERPDFNRPEILISHWQQSSRSARYNKVREPPDP